MLEPTIKAAVTAYFWDMPGVFYVEDEVKLVGGRLRVDVIAKQALETMAIWYVVECKSKPVGWRAVAQLDRYVSVVRQLVHPQDEVIGVLAGPCMTATFELPREYQFLTVVER